MKTKVCRQAHPACTALANPGIGSGGGGKKNGPTVPQEVNDSWEKLMDDVSPLCYVLALYSSNGKALELVASGPEEGPAGGCG